MIRKYKEDDLEALLSIWYEASLLAHPFLSDEFLAQERINIREIYMPKADTWVYEEDGQVVGFISLIENEVGGIFVEPERHGTGIGRSLMDKAREIHETLEVEVYKANTQALRFYERYGFVTFKEYMREDTKRPMLRMRLEE